MPGRDDLGIVTTIDDSYIKKITDLQNKLKNGFSMITDAELEAEDELNKLRLNNIQNFYNTQLQNIQTIKQAGLIASKEEYDAKVKQIKDTANQEVENAKAKALEEKKRKKGDSAKLTKDEIAKIEAEVNTKHKKELTALDKQYKAGKKLSDKYDKATKIERLKAAEEEAKKRGLTGKAAKTFVDSKLADLGMSEDDIKKTKKDAKKAAIKDDVANKLADGYKAILNFAESLNGTIEDIAGYKTAIDTRLQGSKSATQRDILTGANSYWDKMSKDITGIAGVSPFVKQADIVKKIDDMIGQGISFNVEQRAFLATISDKIATTFNAADGTLLRLVRLQQQDSTAARLGMESAMTAFLNNMYETTEYLEGVAERVRGSLEEAQSLMGTNQALEFEYQVQKWLGSLYSVGMSDSAITSLSNAIGQLASGDISGLTGEGTGNLMIMAANNAGLSIADMLATGLDASSTNKLLEAMTEYLAGIYDESKGSKVIQQQFASVYGLTASDLKAATNLIDQNNTTLNAIAGNNLTYNTAMQQLTTMANTMYQRTSLGQMMTNAMDNLQYSMAAGIANNPVWYATYKVAGMLNDVVGGIALPDIKVMGSGVNLQTSVADLMNVAALSGGLLSSIGQMIASGSGGGFSGVGMLNALGIGNEQSATVQRGTGQGLTTSGVTVSSSGYVGNSSSGDVYDKTLTDANDSTKSQMAEAKESEDTDVTNKVINESVLSIYTLLDSVINGTASLKVSPDDSGNSWTRVMSAGQLPQF